MRYSYSGILIGLGIISGIGLALVVFSTFVLLPIFYNSAVDCNTLTMQDMTNYTNKHFTNLDDFKKDCKQTEKQENDTIPMEITFTPAIVVSVIMFIIFFPVLGLHEIQTNRSEK